MSVGEQVNDFLSARRGWPGLRRFVTRVVWLVLLLAPRHQPDAMVRASGVSLMKPIGSVELPAAAQDLVVRDDYVFVASDGAGLRVVNASDPSAPAEVAAVGSMVAKRMVASRGWIFVVDDGDPGQAWADDILYVFDVTKPLTPINEMVGYELNGEAVDLVMLDDYRLITAVQRESPHPRDGWLENAWVFNMRSPIVGQYVGRVKPPGNQLAISEHFLYTTTSAPAGGNTSGSLGLDIAILRRL